MCRKNRFAGFIPQLLLAALLIPGMAHAQPVLERVSDGSFSRPHDLKLSPDGKRLYVADLGNDAVKVLDPDSLKVLGVIGADQLDDPHDVTFDGQGRLLVADTGNDRIAIFTVSGNGGTFAGALKGGLSGPEGVVVAKDGSVYVANASGHSIVIFRAGRPVRSAGKHGSAPGEMIRPHDIDIAGTGEIVVADPGNNRLQVFSPELKPLAEIGGPSYGFNEPKYFAVAPGGVLAVVDQHNNRVVILDPARKPRWIFPERNAPARERLKGPEGAEIRGNSLWLSDTYNNRILRYRLPDGIFR